MHCLDCSKEILEENDIKRGICFSCHIKGIKFGFKGTFHILLCSWYILYVHAAAPLLMRPVLVPC